MILGFSAAVQFVLAVALAAPIVVASMWALLYWVAKPAEVVDDDVYEAYRREYEAATFPAPLPPAIDVDRLITTLMTQSTTQLETFARLVESVTAAVGQTIAVPYGKPDVTRAVPGQSAPVPFYATEQGQDEMAYDPMDELIARSRDFGATATVGGQEGWSSDPDARHWTGIDGMVEG